MGLYLPGYGYVPREESDMNVLVRSYDQDLVFKRHPKTNAYTLFQRMQRDSVYVKHADAVDLVDGDLFPLITWKDRMPSEVEVRKWLYENDQYRQDTLERVEKHNARLKARQKADLQPEIRHRAELLEHGFRMLGEDTGRSVSLPNSGKRRRTFG